MVNYSDIVQGNKHFSRQHWNAGDVVGVFAGATSGIGARTLERMTTMFRTPTFYVLGRSSARFASQRKTLESLNPGCKIVYIETDVSLISGIESACRQIKAAEAKVDYLYMSMGGLPLAGAQYTNEGLETCFALSYFCRARLLFGLLPLLNRSTRPRVLSVLNGGREAFIDEQDLGLERKWSLQGVVNQTTLLTSLTFDGIAAQNSKLTLIHNAPGLVESDNLKRINPPADMTILRRVYIRIVRFIFTVMRYFMGMSPKEAGERQTYHLTSDVYGPGSFRVSKSSDVVPDNEALLSYRADGWVDRAWQFTLATWTRALAVGSGSDLSQEHDSKVHDS